MLSNKSLCWVRERDREKEWLGWSMMRETATEEVKNNRPESADKITA